MTHLAVFTELGAMMDAVAIACSLMMILLMLRYRRKYGISANRYAGTENSVATSSQLATVNTLQQSEDAGVDRPQRPALNVAAWHLVAGDDGHFAKSRPRRDNGYGRKHGIVRSGGGQRNYRYRQAEEMIGQGTDGRQIMQQCGLRMGELELLTGLRQLQQGFRP